VNGLPVWALTAGAVVLVAACGERPVVRADFDPGPAPAEHADGKRTFEARCARCHGVNGVGTDAGPPLVHVVYQASHHADMAFERAVALGVPAHHWRFGNMPPVSGVDLPAVRRITAYVRWLQRQAGIE
jgi:cytochrome c